MDFSDSFGITLASLRTAFLQILLIQLDTIDWTDDGIFFYTGEGQRGDMQFVRGNKAVREHFKNGKEVYLFSYGQRRGWVRYVGQMVCIERIGAQVPAPKAGRGPVMDLVALHDWSPDQSSPDTLSTGPFRARFAPNRDGS